MTHRARHIALLLSMLGATVAGCSTDEGGGGSGGCGEELCSPTGGEGGSGGAGGGARVSEDDGAGGSNDADSTASAATGQGGGTGTGTGAGDGGFGPEPQPECETCCTGSPQIGEPRYVVRVDDSNSFASPFLVDALLPEWNGKTPLPVRTHEFLNVYGTRIADDFEGDDVVVDWGAAPIAELDGEHLVAIQVAARHLATAERPQRTVALVVDTSPSIAASVERLLGAIDAVVEQLGPADRLGVYSWSPDPLLRELRPMSDVGNLDRAALEGAVVRAVEAREPGAEPGTALRTAIDQASLAATTATSVLLVSDGSTGIDEGTLDVVRKAASGDKHVRVVGIGVGPARAYSDEVLDAITDASGGASMYFDGSPAARALIEERFRELVDVAKRDVRLRLSMPDSAELVVTSAGDASAVGNGEVAGQNLAADGTMTFHEIVRWTGDPLVSPCDAIGWTLEDAEGELESGTITLGDVVARRAITPATHDGLAVVAAAAALEGPTPERMARAFTAMEDAFAARGTWAGTRLEPLCASLTAACARLAIACSACPVETSAP